MPAAAATLSLHDHEKANSVGFHIPVLGVGNVVTYTDWDEALTLTNNLILAVAAVCVSEVWSLNISALAQQIGSVVPTDPTVRNENKLILKYVDTVEPSLKGRMEFPGVDIALIGQAGTDVVDMTQTEVAALITAVEAFAVSKIGNPIQVYAALTVGRPS